MQQRLDPTQVCACPLKLWNFTHSQAPSSQETLTKAVLVPENISVLTSILQAQKNAKQYHTWKLNLHVRIEKTAKIYICNFHTHSPLQTQDKIQTGKAGEFSKQTGKFENQFKIQWVSERVKSTR